MSGELPIEGIAYSLDERPQRFFRVAILLSVALHFAAILTGPLWESRPAVREEVLQVEIADISPRELRGIPEPAVALPTAPPRRTAVRSSAPVRPSPELTRERIREKVASQGVLKVLSARKAGGGAADPFPGIRIPEGIRVRQGAPSANSYPVSRGYDELPAATRGTPGIGRQETATSRSPATPASRIFRTDAGLDAEISGGIDDEGRSAGAIASTVTQYRSGIRYAYNRELLKNPNLSGRITVAFVILSDGSVASAEIRQSSVHWPPLDEAVINRIRHWNFPKSKGAPVTVVFPFVFHPEM